MVIFMMSSWMLLLVLIHSNLPWRLRVTRKILNSSQLNTSTILANYSYYYWLIVFFRLPLVHGVMGYYFSESVGNVFATLQHVGQSRASHIAKYVDFFAVIFCVTRLLCDNIWLSCSILYILLCLTCSVC